MTKDRSSSSAVISSDSSEDQRRYQEVLSKEFYEDAFKLLGETSEIRNEQILIIAKWLDENPNINGHNDPRTIIFFLRGCKFDVEKTKKKMKW